MRCSSSRTTSVTIAAALNSLLFDAEVRARILEAAPSVLARYSWANAAQQTLDAIEAAGR